MSDTMTPEQRHRCMSRIRSKNTKPELIVRRWLWRQGFRYRLHVGALPGSPDIVLQRLQVVIFVNGCFWHGHERCATFRLPASNQEFWRQKIDNNRQRDARNAAWLRRMGWHVFTVWECQLTPARRQRTLLGLSQRLSTLTLAAYHTVAAPYPDVELTATPLAAEGTRS